MIVLALLLIYSADATNLEHAIQHRLFGSFINEMNSDPNTSNENDNVFDDIKYEANPKLRHLDDLMKARQR